MSETINRKYSPVERPDKTMFFVMMGSFFVFFSLPAFYWAYYNYGQYQRTTTFVQTLRVSSEEFLTPNEREERKNRISINVSMAERYKFEMILSGAGGLVLLGISLLFLKGAVKARNNKQSVQFERIDWSSIPMPTGYIEVRYKKLYDVLFGLTVLLFGTMFVLVVSQNFTSAFSGAGDPLIRSLMLAVPILLFIIPFCYVMLRAKRRAVLHFDATGIKRGDGRHFPWSEFRGVVTQININQRTRNRYVWRIELACAEGESAWIIPNRIKNRGEVMNFIDSLPGTRLKMRA